MSKLHLIIHLLPASELQPNPRFEVTVDDSNCQIKELVEEFYQELRTIVPGQQENNKPKDLILCNSSKKRRILRQTQTIKEAQLISNDSLLIIDTAVVAQHYLQGTGIEIDNDSALARLPEASIPEDIIDLPRKVRLVFESLEHYGKLADLMLLALLRWREDRKIRNIINALVPVGQIYELAPYASRSFTTQEREFLYEIWQNRRIENPSIFVSPITSLPKGISPNFQVEQEPLNLQFMDDKKLIHELGNCFEPGGAMALSIFIEIGFPQTLVSIDQSSDNKAYLYWIKVCTYIENGLLSVGKEEGFKKLLQAAASRVIGNPKFAPWRKGDE